MRISLLFQIDPDIPRSFRRDSQQEEVKVGFGSIQLKCRIHNVDSRRS